MSESTIEIRCVNCRAWFPSPIYLGDGKSFDTSTLAGNLVQCPRCGKMTGCNKDNMRARFPDGGHLGGST